MISPELKERVWAKAIVIDGFEPNEVRKDVCGAYIIKKFSNRENIYAWEIDHISPVSVLKAHNVPEALIDNIINLRPLCYRNNISKADDIPVYNVSVEGIDDTNCEVSKKKRVLDTVLQAVLAFYKDKGYDIKL